MITTQPTYDETNIPSYTVLNGFVMPTDTQITFDSEKIIPETKILDGAFVFERVGRKPIEINFDFVIREKDDFGKYIFGQNNYYDLWMNVWQADSVVPIVNTFLNKIGINNVVIKSVHTTTVRGNTNIPCSIRCSEMYNSVSQQKSLIIPV